MSKETDILHKAGLALGIATFLISNATANPFQAQVIKTDYIQKPDADPIITPNGFEGTTAEDVIPGTTGANTPHTDNPVYASDKDPFSNGAHYEVKPYDGKCGMSGNGE